MADSRLVALTGATGFVGRHVLPQLLDRGHRVRILARNPERLTAAHSDAHAIKGDLFNDAALSQLVQGADAVVHLVGIIMEKPSAGQTFERIHTEATTRLLAAARNAGVKRWVHMSALGARPGVEGEEVSRYHQTKWAAEAAVRSSGLEWAIFRPSLIHGPDGEFMQMVKDFWTKAVPPFVPYFGAGACGTRGCGTLQPVWVEDVATCFAQAVDSPRAVGETYPLGGPDVYTWPEFYAAAKRNLPTARDKKIVAIPAWLARRMAAMPGVPFNEDQVVMSLETPSCQTAKVREDFNLELAAFEPTMAGYAGKIGEKN